MSKAKKIRYDHLTFRLADWGEEEKLIDFVNDNFDYRLPLVNNRRFFDYYYCGKRLQFALAEQDGVLVAVAGYIVANESDTPDLWVSVWVALKGAMGAGLELMNAIPTLTNARVVACNNIRENTCAFYQFLGWTAERLPHYYRPNQAAQPYRLYRPAVSEATAAAVALDLPLVKVETAAQLHALGLPTANKQTPAKDLAYLQRRYFDYPYVTYDLWAVQEGGVLLAYCVTRTVQAYFEGEEATTPVLRIVDYIGAPSTLPRIGGALDALMQAEHAEYTDCYCAGIGAEVFAAAGFAERGADSTAIVPNYLTSALLRNTEYFYFTNAPAQFTMFKADGDQDRPNLPE